MMKKGLTSKQRQKLKLQEAHGKIHVLSIGIDDYDNVSGFSPLKTCSNDAITVGNTFSDIWQLNASKIKTLTSKGKIAPSKGEVFKAVSKFSRNAEAKDRLLVYYSGHGHGIKDDKGEEKFYLVPQDAYTDNDPDALVSFEKFLDLIKSSAARQKIIILDACLSGPSISPAKTILPKFSKKFLAEYMKKTEGVVILTSSTDSQESYTKSPNPQLSLFSHFLINALQGNSEAIDEGLLTINSLYEYVSINVQRYAKSYHKDQRPSIDVKSTGTIIIGDFSRAIVPSDILQLDEFPVTELKFKEHEKLDADEVLTNIKRYYAYSEEYLEDKVNDNLDSYLENKFGRIKAKLRKAMGFPVSDVGIYGTEIEFPSGSFSTKYVSEGRKRGKLIDTLSIGQEWFDRPESISKLIDCFDMHPTSMKIELSSQLNPLQLISGLESRDWEITSELTHEIIAKKSGYAVIVKPSSISFNGFSPYELFGETPDKKKSQMITHILSLIGP